MTRPLHCSFCSKSQHDVRKLIAGPGAVFICDECVLLSVQIIFEPRKPKKPNPLAAMMRGAPVSPAHVRGAA